MKTFDDPVRRQCLRIETRVSSRLSCLVFCLSVSQSVLFGLLDKDFMKSPQDQISPPIAVLGLSLCQCHSEVVDGESEAAVECAVFWGLLIEHVSAGEKGCCISFFPFDHMVAGSQSYFYLHQTFIAWYAKNAVIFGCRAFVWCRVA